eukprot:1196104-Prorocentrum_minimum.AAC.3
MLPPGVAPAGHGAPHGRPGPPPRSPPRGLRPSRPRRGLRRAEGLLRAGGVRIPPIENSPPRSITRLCRALDTLHTRAKAPGIPEYRFGAEAPRRLHLTLPSTAVAGTRRSTATAPPRPLAASTSSAWTTTAGAAGAALQYRAALTGGTSGDEKAEGSTAAVKRSRCARLARACFARTRARDRARGMLLASMGERESVFGRAGKGKFATGWPAGGLPSGGGCTLEHELAQSSPTYSAT